MAGKPRRHVVDGEWTTVAEAAGKLGLTAQQLYAQMRFKDCGLQAAVNMIRENQCMNNDSGQRYMVDGRWMSIRQAAEAFGLSICSLRNWRYGHPDAQGNPGSLQEAVDHYREGIERRGNKPVQHRVGRRTMTTFEVAERYGVTVNSVRLYMRKHQCSLAATMRYYEGKQQRQAEKDILRILGY